MECGHEQEQVLSEEEEVALLVQPPRKLAQVASGQLGRLHSYEGSGEREVLALEE